AEDLLVRRQAALGGRRAGRSGRAAAADPQPVRGLHAGVVGERAVPDGTPLRRARPPSSLRRGQGRADRLPRRHDAERLQAGTAVGEAQRADPPLTRRGQDMATGIPTTDKQAPGPKLRVPPEEKFWKRYSPHGEAPLSLVGSFALHALAVG